jgi:hypothetical protein
MHRHVYQVTAALAYDDKALELMGDQATTNFNAQVSALARGGLSVASMWMCLQAGRVSAIRQLVGCKSEFAQSLRRQVLSIGAI